MYLCGMKYRMVLKYDGSAFCGWQIQPAKPSVQQTLEQALATLLGTPATVTGAGRTDTGVHASFYVAHFETPQPVADTAQLRYRMNGILPVSISVEAIDPVPDDFHARFDATRREYTYFLHRRKDPFLARYSYFYGYPGLDFEVMNSAAQDLLGRHDCSCFEKTGTDNRTSVCTIFEAGWHPYTPVLHSLSEECVPGDQASAWYFRIAADRFLRNMVRAVVGTLLEIGRGKRSPDDIARIIGPVLPEGTDAWIQGDPAQERSSRRPLAGESVPGHALFLSRIEYR